MRILRAEIAVTRTPMRRAVRWTEGGTDDAVEHLRLTLEDQDGARGLSETTCKPAWNGVDGATLACAIERLVWPRIAGGDADAARRVVVGLRGAVAVQAAVVNALADLERDWPAVVAPVAHVIGRADPAAMVEEAAAMVEAHGLRALKVKAGAGLAADRAALEGARRVLGTEGTLTIDANSAYAPGEGVELTRIAAGVGAAFVEDPWPLAPDAATERALNQPAAPVCADRALDRPDLADGLLDRGVSVLACKPSRLGLIAADAIRATAHRRDACIVRALFAEGPVGAAFLARGASDFPIEALFHLGLDAPANVEGMVIQDGALHIPKGRLADIARPPASPALTLTLAAP